MILDQYLGESTIGYNGTVVEATNEGYDFEFGGFEQVLSECGSDSHKLNMALMVAEVSCVKVLSEGGDIEKMQENVFTSFWEKLKSIVKSMWARLKEVMGTVVLYFTKMTSNDAFLQSARKQLKDLKNFKDLSIEGYVFTLDKVAPKDMYSKMYSLLETSFKPLTTPGAATGRKAKMEVLKQREFKNKIVKAALSTCTSESDWDSALTKALRNGQSSKKSITFNQSECEAAIEEFKSRKSDIDSIKTEVDVTHSETLKEITDKQSECEDLTTSSKDEDAKLGSGPAGVYKEWANMLKDVQIKCNIAINYKIKAIKEECSQSKTVIMKAISQGRSNDRSDKKNESSYDGNDLLGQYMSNM